jgi:6-phosphogluconolactonase
VTNREVIVCSDTDELGRKAAAEFVGAAQQAIREDGRVSVALSGGSTPRVLYERLAAPQFSDRIPWERVHLFWGDERCVPPDHADSNYRMVRESLLSKIEIPAGNVHRMAGEKEPRAAAAEYEAQLREFFALAPGAWPCFDVILLGVGEDGHTASLFPGTEALNETQRLVVANYVPKLNAYRLTLTLPVLNRGRCILFLVAGSSKAGVIRQILGGETQKNEITSTSHDHGFLSSSVLPAAQVQPIYGRLVWLFTRDAAAELPL